MDGHGEFSSALERSRLIRSVMDGCSTVGGSAGIGITGSHPVSVSEYAGRSVTPTTLTLTQYHNSRYGIPSSIPGSNLAIMNSLLSSGHNSEARKALLIDFQQYWGAHNDNFPRYLMTGGLYPSYQPLLPGTAESLSLLGAGVACVATGAPGGVGPSHSQHVVHYQRLLEMEKQACLASMSAAAAAAVNQHPTIYGISAGGLPSFLDHATFTSHGSSPFSLVKQEPRDLSCIEKTNRPSERRAGGCKADLDSSKASQESFTLSPASTQGNTQLKEPKLSPTTSQGSSGKLDKRASNSYPLQGSNNGTRNVKKLFANISTSRSKQNPELGKSSCTSPSNRAAQQTLPFKGASSSVASKKSGSKMSQTVSKHAKTSTSTHTVSIVTSISSLSNTSLPESPIISVPTQAAAPIPLATVQHDGVVLSALASPSSAAASLVSTKTSILKQQTDRINRPLGLDHDNCSKPQTVANTLNNNDDDENENTHKDSDVGVPKLGEDFKSNSDDSCDIIVDSTENEDTHSTTASSILPASEQNQAIAGVIEKIDLSSGSTCVESCLNDVTCAKSSPDASKTSTLLSVTRAEPACVISSSAVTSGARTVYAKTQQVPSVTASDCFQMTNSAITTQASVSVLPYYHTLYSKPEGVKRVHATTFVPEVGVFKGPSIKAMTKSSHLNLSAGMSSSSSEHRSKIDKKSASNICPVSPNEYSRTLESTSSLSLFHPSGDLVSLGCYSSTASPVVAHTTTSSIDSASPDSASMRSQSVASFHSVPEADDSYESFDDGNDLVIDNVNNDNSEVVNDEYADISQGSDIKEYQISKDKSLNKTNTFINRNVDKEVPLINNKINDTDDKLCNGDNDNGCPDNELIINRIKSEIIIVCDLPVLDPSKGQSIPEIHTHQVPSKVSDTLSCDTAIDYSLPKFSSNEDTIHQQSLSSDPTIPTSNPSYIVSTTSNLMATKKDSTHQNFQTNPKPVGVKELEQTPQTNISSLLKPFPRSGLHYSSKSTSKLITSPRKPLNRLEGTLTSVVKSLPLTCSPNKRLKTTSDYTKPTAINPASLDILSKIARRLKLQVNDDTQRCGSAPPTSAHWKLHKSNLLPASEISNDKELNLVETVEGSSDHILGNNIPVGIAVAQIRPHHIHQQRESQTAENLSRDIRHSSISNRNSSQTNATVVAPTGTVLPPNLVVAGCSVSSTPWIQHMPFSHHPSMNPSVGNFDPRYPISAPRGFKLAHDSLTGQFFLVPSEDFVETNNVWPATSFVQSPVTSNTHYQAGVALASIRTNGSEGSDRLAKEQSVEKSTAKENRIDRTVPGPDAVCKKRDVPAKGTDKCGAISQPDQDRKNCSPSLAELSSNTAQTITVVNSASNILTSSPTIILKSDQPAVESRGCSPIVFDNNSSSSPLSVLSSSLASKKTVTIGVQTSNDLLKRNRKRKSLPTKLISLNQAIQTVCHDVSILNPLSVQCPDLDTVESTPPSIDAKNNNERPSYNPFTDPQILQAADGLELLSALAEKRTKYSSIDDPKRIFPSPSDSFKSDSASIAAIDDTHSSVESDVKSGQCTPRKDVLRDVSPKWSIPKKEPYSVPVFMDFKTPTDMQLSEESEVRVKMAEVQRQYKEKQKELAKLQHKKSEVMKPSKRGPGRPPKRKGYSQRSDDESYNSPVKSKEHHQPQRKKRPAEELVDRVFRKLPPVIKTCKVSRSIHYVKSKTGPFFRRKSASSSVKRNKDLFGFDESNWPSFSERKYQEKIKVTGSFTGKGKSKHRPSSGHYDDRRHSNDVGNIFSSLESFGCGRRIQTLKHHSFNHRKALTSSGDKSVRSAYHCDSSHQDSCLGLLAKSALTVTANSFSSTNVTSLASLTNSSTSTSGNQSSLSSFSSNTFISTNICSSSIYCSSLYNSCSSMYNKNSATSGSQAPDITFGSLSSLMSSPSSAMMSFNSPNLTALCNPPSTTSAFSQVATISTASPMLLSPTSTTNVSATPLFPSPGAQNSSSGESSSGTSTTSRSKTKGNTANSSARSSGNSSSNGSTTSNCTGSSRSTSPSKKRHEEDSDTDASDTSPNKKRKPGRPRKINPEQSSGGTETIWAKKSSNIGLLQISDPSCTQVKEGSSRKPESKSLKPLFLNEEWARRRSERIFLNEPSSLPLPSLSPSEKVQEPVWKLSHFMPKSKKVQEANKDEETSRTDSSHEQISPFLTSATTSTSLFSSSTHSNTLIKTDEKKHSSPTANGSKTSVKTTEISSVKFDNAKIILKIKHPSLNTQAISSSTLPEKSAINYKSDKARKKKLTKKICKAELSSPSPSSEKNTNQVEEHSKIKFQRGQSLYNLTQRVKKKFSKSVTRKQRDNQLKDSKSKKSKRESSSDSCKSQPLASVGERPYTPEPRSCKLQQSDLREGLQVLYLIGGLFHEGTVKELQPPDVYGVLTAGQRGSRPHILCLEEILKLAVLDVKPGSLRYLPEGTRVCAFWSQKFSCLYPGTVAKSPSPQTDKKAIVPVEFDDGDNGNIELDHIRLLPPDFSIVEYEPDPLQTLPKKKQPMPEMPNVSKLTDKRQNASKKSADSDNDSDVESDNEVYDESETKTKDNFLMRELWRWKGNYTKKQSSKGKGRAKKTFFKSITRNNEAISVGDSAVFISTEKVDCPYIGRIVSLWESWSEQMKVKVHWYYHPQETEPTNKKLSDPKNALFQSNHEDENDVQTIARKCEVIPYVLYKQLLNESAEKNEPLRPNLYYLAGFYDPSAKTTKFYPDVTVQAT